MSNMSSTTAWAWVIVPAATEAIFGGFRADGIFRTRLGVAVDLGDDLAEVRFVGDRTRRLAGGRDGHLRLIGDTCRAAALLRCVGAAGFEPMTLEDLAEHPQYGETMPSLETILAAYAVDEAIAA